MKGLKGMKKMNQELKNRDQGFTLIELIIVIAILAIIAAIAIPNIMGAVEKSKKTADIANGKVIANAVALAEANGEKITYPISMKTIAGQTASELYKALNGGIPVPKYNSTTNTQFYVTYVANKLSVYAAPDGATVATVKVDDMVYPTPGNNYK